MTDGSCFVFLLYAYLVGMAVKPGGDLIPEPGLAVESLS